MDIEQLSKTQIILLTLLVTFVTSIATGIVTVSLLDQAPPAVTQTINRVVERTVERVVPDKMPGAAAASKEVTVVVKEDDLITSSIEKNAKSIVRIYGYVKDEETGEPVNAFLGLGTVLTRDGTIVTDAAVAYVGGVYTVVDANGATHDAKGVHAESGGQTALLAVVPKKDAKESFAFAPATLAQGGTLKLGQSVIALSGRDRTSVSLGIIGSLFTEEIPASVGADGKKTATTTVVALADTSVSGPVSPGSPFVNIFGDVIGFSTGAARAKSRSAFLPASAALDELSAYAAENAPKTP